MNVTKKALVLVCVVSLIASSSLVLALSSWTHTYSWNKTVSSFNVYLDSACTQEFASGGTTSITDFSQPYVQTFYIKNTGNTAITVQASATVTGASHAWSPSSSTGSVAVGAVASLQLTISNFADGAGSCVVSFSLGA
ncbi:MAG: hypothetical protein WC325_12220 [Candidatus Bathyarchaeia archaeon]